MAHCANPAHIGDEYAVHYARPVIISRCPDCVAEETAAQKKKGR